MVDTRSRRKRKSPAVNRVKNASTKKRKTMAPTSIVEGDAAERRNAETETAETAETEGAEAETVETEEAETAEVETAEVETAETETAETETAEAETEKTVEEETNDSEQATESDKGEDEEGEDGDDEEREEDWVSDSRNANAWAEKEAWLPLMYFPAEEYSKSIKVSTRCHVLEVLETFNDLDLTETERVWFEEHPQFCHIMHMPKSNHMVQPMWMMLLRNAEIQRKKEAWFVVNGIPIRYGLREHAMISGLDCCNYPLDWQRLGSSSFKKKHFPDPKKKDKKKGKKQVKKKKIVREYVRERLKKMGPDDTGDRLKMAVLYFLSSIVYCPTKTGPSGKPVLDIFVRYVADLDLCKTFPWGRFSFDRMLESIHSTMSHFNGVVSGDWTMPGFCLPLELLAMEAIPELKRSFRELVPAPYDDCPRMCKGKWLKCELRGWPLETVYEKLGKTKDIESVLIASEEEKEILEGIMEKEDDVDEHDPVVESWEERLHNGLTVEFQDMMEEDLKGREKKVEERAVTGGRKTWKASLAELTGNVHSLINQMGILSEKVEILGQNLEDRIKPLEEYVKLRTGKVFGRRDGNGKGKHVSFE